MEKSDESLQLRDAKRLLAVNAGEQKRLEKFHKYIDKRKREKERSLSRAQREAILKFYESSGKDFDGILYAEKNQNVRGLNGLRPVVSSDAVLQNPETKSNEGNDMKARQNKKVSLQEKSSKTLLPDLDLSNLLTRKSKPSVRWRTRSWSNPTFVGRLDDLASNESRKEPKESVLFNKQKGRSPSLSYLEKNPIQEECEDNSIEEAKSKKPLSAILPPLVLPPLHSHRRPSIKDKNTHKTDDAVSGDKSLKKQYEELSDCRYLRVYHPFIDNQ